MAKERKKIWGISVLLLFIFYFLLAARPIPRETIIASRWLSSLESNVPVGDTGGVPADTARLLPFSLGERFGYVDADGHFSINRIKKDNISLAENFWAEYDAMPSSIEIKTSTGETAFSIEDPRGYPLLLDGRIFLVNSEQNAIREIDSKGNTRWTYEFPAPLTCIDAAAGLLLAGTLDGVVEVLDSQGKLVFPFEPGGSRYAVILGCVFSRDGSRMGIISGIDNQRFLVLEQFGNTGGEYKVIYHEFLEEGFRRPVHIAFIDQDRSLVFERQGGIGIYQINSRQGTKIALDGEIEVIDRFGGQGLFFVVTSKTEELKKLVGIRLPDTIFLEAPFKSSGIFLGRSDSRLLVGGGTTLAAFELEKK